MFTNSLPMSSFFYIPGHPKPRVLSLKTFSWLIPQNDPTDTGRAFACTQKLTSDSQVATQLPRWGTEDAQKCALLNIARILKQQKAGFLNSLTTQEQNYLK